MSGGESCDVMVIGGGIVGAAAAYECARAGQRTLLLDRADRGRATAAGAGIITPLTSRYEQGDAWRALALAAARHYEPLVAALAALGQEDTGYERCGMLLVASDEDELLPFQNAARHLREMLLSSGYDEADLARISSSQAQALFPPLRAPLAVLHDRLAARVDGRKMAAALRAGAAALGADVLEADARRIVRNAAGAITGIETSAGNFQAARYILAGGAWSADFAEQLQLPLPIAPQRGQIAHLLLPEASAPPSEDWPMVGGYRGHYLVAWPGGRVVVGASRESGVGYDYRRTAGGVAEVLGEALRLAPGLSDATLHEVRVGFRPLARDGLPVIGEAPGTANLFLVTGHGPSGLHLGPYSSWLAAQWAQGNALSDQWQAFRPERFL